MKLKQISIFLDNSPGRLYEATQALGDAGLNLRALSICDVSGFGVLRILISDVAKARRVIMEKQLPARVDDVVAAEIADTPGSLASVLKLLMSNKINVDYMYALAGTSLGKAVMVFSFSDNDLAIKLFQENNIKILDADSFGILESPA